MYDVIDRTQTFFFELYFEESAPKMWTNQLTNGVYFFQQFCRLSILNFVNSMLHKYFPRFLRRFVVNYKEFLKILPTYVFQ